MRPKIMTARHASLGAALLSMLGSSFAIAQTQKQSHRSKGMEREFVKGRMVTTSATVTRIDRQNRKVWLRAHGEETEVAVGPEVRNFDQIHEGDQVNVTYEESIVAEIRRPGQAAPNMGQRVQTERAPLGAKPSGRMVRETMMTAEVVSVDPNRHKVALRSPDGSIQTFTVKNPDLQRRLGNLKPGDQIDVRYTEGIAISVEPTTPAQPMQPTQPTGPPQGSNIPPIEIEAGGGISDFTGAAASNLTKMGATWQVHSGVRLLRPLRIQAGYIGSTHPINNVLAPFAPGGSNILSNGLEALVDYTFPVHFIVKPFVFAGVGWDHWSLSGGAQNDPLAIKGSDDSLAIPGGAGVRTSVTRNWELDGRFTYRGELLDDMLLTNSAGQPNSGSKSMTTWNATARLGYMF